MSPKRKLRDEHPDVSGAMVMEKEDIAVHQTAPHSQPSTSADLLPTPPSRSSSTYTNNYQETSLSMSVSSTSSGSSFLARIFSPFHHTRSQTDYRPNINRAMSSPLVVTGRPTNGEYSSGIRRGDETGDSDCGNGPQPRSKSKKRSTSTLKRLMHKDGHQIGYVPTSSSPPQEGIQRSSISVAAESSKSRSSLPTLALTPSSPPPPRDSYSPQPDEQYQPQQQPAEKERKLFQKSLISLQRPSYPRSYTETTVPTLKSIHQDIQGADDSPKKDRPISYHGRTSSPFGVSLDTKSLRGQSTAKISLRALNDKIGKRQGGPPPIPILSNRSLDDLGIAVNEPTTPRTGSDRSMSRFVDPLEAEEEEERSLEMEIREMQYFLIRLIQNLLSELMPRELLFPSQTEDVRSPKRRAVVCGDEDETSMEISSSILDADVEIEPTSNKLPNGRPNSFSSSLRSGMSPPSLSYELLSASALNLPTTSLAGVWRLTCCQEWLQGQTFLGPPELEDESVFELGAVLQSVVDVASVLADRKGVEIVLYHGRRTSTLRPDTGGSSSSSNVEDAEDEVDDVFGQVIVKGDERAFTLLFLLVIKEILALVEEGCSIEIGLTVSRVLAGAIASPSPPPRSLRPMSASSPSASSFSSSTTTVQCMVNFHLVPRIGSTLKLLAKGRPMPLIDFNKGLLAAILKHVGLNMFSTRDQDKLQWKLLGNISRGGTSLKADGAEEMKETRLEQGKEPTILELIAFANVTLRGRKIIVHASETSNFAKHLTAYLASWGTDISFDPIAKQGLETEKVPNSASSGQTSLLGIEPTPLQGRAPTEPKLMEDVAFIIIDDDTNTFVREIQNLKNSSVNLSMQNVATRKRAGGSQMGRKKMATLPESKVLPAIIHFTTISKYRKVREIIQSVLATSNSLFPLPDVIVVPKPVGPRRLLTSFHTALKRPKVDPYLSPIATSPSSPGGHYFSSGGAKLSPAIYGPEGDGSTSTLTIIPGGALLTPGGTIVDPSKPPHTPISPDQLGGYFTQALGGADSSLSEGLAIASPDGKTAGLYFQPAGSASGIINAQVDGTKSNISTPNLSGNGATPRRIPLSESQHDGASSTLDHSSNPPSPPKRTLNFSPHLRETFAVPDNPVGTSPTPTKRKVTTPTLNKGIKGKKDKIVPPVNVLIVEDDPINRNILVKSMIRKGIKYNTASNGEEAVEKWKKGGFDLVLMDIQLPVKDGIEATKEIRQLEKAAGIGTFPSAQTSTPPSPLTPSTGSSSVTSSPFRLPVIIVALTASSLQTDKVNALAAGCNDFLTKPVDLQWLHQKVLEWGSMAYLSNFSRKRGESSNSASVDSLTTKKIEEKAKNVAANLRLNHPTHNHSLSMDTITPTSPTFARSSQSDESPVPTPTVSTFQGTQTSPLSRSILPEEDDDTSYSPPTRQTSSATESEPQLKDVVQETHRILSARRSSSRKEQPETLAQVILNSGVVDPSTPLGQT